MFTSNTLCFVKFSHGLGWTYSRPCSSTALDGFPLILGECRRVGIAIFYRLLGVGDIS